LPVIGVPIKSKTLSGIDSLYSIVQMPAGIPVATVAINGAKNAGILAASILSISDSGIAEKLSTFKDTLTKTVQWKASELEKVGYEAYLTNME
jgi:5-(carboxyamino)imidazole ribonucleotide mutase